jgi:transposase
MLSSRSVKAIQGHRAKRYALYQHVVPLRQQEVSQNSIARTLQRMIRERQADALSAWLEQAEQCAVPTKRGFAAGLRQDYAAVAAAMEQVWSNGQVEGQITKLKLIKRQMYGRAQLDLLKSRLLHAA